MNKDVELAELFLRCACEKMEIPLEGVQGRQKGADLRYIRGVLSRFIYSHYRVSHEELGFIFKKSTRVVKSMLDYPGRDADDYYNKLLDSLFHKITGD